MARQAGSTISQEELYPHRDEAACAELDDARLLDLDEEEESPFLRAQKRVSVRRASLARKTASYLGLGASAILILFLGSITVAAAYHYGEHSWRFRIESSDDIEITGLSNVTRLQVIEVMGGDIGRNVFYVPLAQRKKQLEQIPWVESASVMRFVPNRLKIEIRERAPVAFARVGSRIFLIDGSGVLMELPVMSKKKFSFPVVLGMSLAEPQSTRAARMKTYNQLMTELDSGGAHYSQGLSEVDVSDPDDVKILTDDSGGGVLIHLGSSNFLERFRVYVSHVQEWRRQFVRLDSVDLRYEHQIVVNPDLQGTAKQAPLTTAALRAAMAAGVKPAALISHQPVKTEMSSPAARSAANPATKSVPTNKRTAKFRRRKAVATRNAAAAKTGISSASIATQETASQKPAAQTTSSRPPTNSTLKLSKPSPAIPKGQQ
jgi:cell division protein FtsQ